METKNITIGNITIGEEHPCVVIPEGCDNHRGSLDNAKALAYNAREAGAEIIKFQMHLPDEEMDRRGMAETSSEMFSKWGDLYGFIQENLLSVDNHAKLISFCKEIGIQYFCTPFSSRAAEILKEIGGDVAYKIGSGETEDLPMIEDVARLGKPMIISTGMTRLDEIDLTVEAVRKEEVPFALAHCISAYPPKSLKDLHLGAIRTLKERYGVVVGFSDHTMSEGIVQTNGTIISESEIIWSALAHGAKFVEKHFTLDREAKDADSRFSHDKKTLKRLIETVRNAEEAMDDTRDVYESEKPVHIWAKRSLFAGTDIPQGILVTREMLKSKRPGTGIRSKNYKSIVGRLTRRNIKKDEMIRLEDLF
ncbi:MAG: N-acetylneuraminate synthase family protein [Parcubacteria group bacterium]|nr:N-acetylneuraminate synthase family protein [Parcubacteria group bacterium]